MAESNCNKFDGAHKHLGHFYSIFLLRPAEENKAVKLFSLQPFISESDLLSVGWAGTDGHCLYGRHNKKKILSGKTVYSVELHTSRCAWVYACARMLVILKKKCFAGCCVCRQSCVLQSSRSESMWLSRRQDAGLLEFCSLYAATWPQAVFPQRKCVFKLVPKRFGMVKVFINFRACRMLFDTNAIVVGWGGPGGGWPISL